MVWKCLEGVSFVFLKEGWVLKDDVICVEGVEDGSRLYEMDGLRLHLV